MIYEFFKMLFQGKKQNQKSRLREIKAQNALENFLNQAQDQYDLEQRYKEWDRMNSSQKSLWRV